MKTAVKKWPEEARLMSVLADPTRMRILQLIRGRTQACPTEIKEELGIGFQASSKHLKLLKASGLLESRKDGHRVQYSIRPVGFRSVVKMLEQYISN